MQGDYLGGCLGEVRRVVEGRGEDQHHRDGMSLRVNRAGGVNTLQTNARCVQKGIRGCRAGGLPCSNVLLISCICTSLDYVDVLPNVVF